LISGLVVGLASYGFTKLDQNNLNDNLVEYEKKLEVQTERVQTLESKIEKLEELTKGLTIEKGLTLEKLQAFNDTPQFIKGTIVPISQEPPNNEVIRGKGVFDWGDT
jgi:hypothetical protein